MLALHENIFRTMVQSGYGMPAKIAAFLASEVISFPPFVQLVVLQQQPPFSSQLISETAENASFSSIFWFFETSWR